MYTVIGSKTTRAFRVLWALEEMGLPYRHEAEKPRSATVVALNPSGKVPVLQDGNAVLTDSMAILTYLADKHGQLTHPAGTIARARQDALTFLLLDEFDALLWVAARHSFILPPELRVKEVKDSLKWEFAESAARLAPQVKGPFLMGETMTIADILCAHVLQWAASARFPDPGEVLNAYRARMEARPAWIRLQD
ncbi:MAG: glutathione S-transferase [Limimaricola sp.]|uniref:glutathione S-transferase family protein n=1 Tax=Limimaricola sp. TaxID=2211665 RepID=UPI001D544074|nr:glutathione S-transferase family protein [Limimaricola sp.]MBI1417013.1 glutathione S-transferase [Limimaricola sp.]